MPAATWPTRLCANDSSLSVGRRRSASSKKSPGPSSALSEYILLRQRKVVYPVLRIARPGNIHLRHAAVTNPHGRPILKRLSGNMLERAYKIAPFRTGVRMLGEIEAQALPEMIFPEDKGELVENPGSFGINDRAVGGFRVFEIGDVLIDGCCALGRIDPISGRFDGLIEALPDVLVRLYRGQRLISHVLRETLLQPQVVKPAHGGEVAEPLVCQLMKHKDVAIEVVAVRRRRPEENRFLSQKSCSGVFHSAIGKTGNEHHVILGKRERLGEEAGKIIDSLGRDLLHFRRLLFRLLEFGLP